MSDAAINEVNEPTDIGFVACIESGVLEAQALLLFESIRLFTGCLKDCSIYALSPRAGHRISAGARERLDELNVHYSDKILNTEGGDYGSANRVAAAAYVEDTCAHEILVILDSDTLFLREPSDLMLSLETDVAVRPVDVKGVATAGAEDPLDKYWRDLCRCCGVPYDAVPRNESFVDRRRIKANYNGGLVVVRRRSQVLRRCSDFFFKSIREGIRPDYFALNFRAGTGWVGPKVGRLWGSSQAALSLAIWSSTRRVRELPATYNYPLHLHEQVDRRVARELFPHLVHAHYHWLFETDALMTNPLFHSQSRLFRCRTSPLSKAQVDWLRSRTPLS